MPLSDIAGEDSGAADDDEPYIDELRVGFRSVCCFGHASVLMYGRKNSRSQLTAHDCTQFSKFEASQSEILETCKYLGRVTAKDNNDEEVVKRNLGLARGKWASMRRFLIQDDVRPKTMAVFYRTVMMYILLYRRESWVLMKDLMHQLRSFHRRCCQGLARDFIRQDEEGNWSCPSAVTRF